MGNSFISGVHYVLCLLKRPVSVIVPWFLRQYRRLLALLALAETGIVVMTAHRINFEFQFTKPCTVYPGCSALYVCTNTCTGAVPPVMPLKVALVAAVVSSKHAIV